MSSSSILGACGSAPAGCFENPRLSSGHPNLRQVLTDAVKETPNVEESNSFSSPIQMKKLSVVGDFVVVSAADPVWSQPDEPFGPFSHCNVLPPIERVHIYLIC